MRWDILEKNKMLVELVNVNVVVINVVFVLLFLMGKFIKIVYIVKFL